MERFHIGLKYEYCPNGNYWSEISGMFDTRIYLYCDCNKCGEKVYELKPIDVTKKVSPDVIKSRKEWLKL